MSRCAVLMCLVAGSWLLACSHADLSVRLPLHEPVNRVALSVSATREATSMTDMQLSRVRSTLTSALAANGVAVVSETDEPGVPLLQGQVERYEEGNRYVAGLVPGPLGNGYFQSTWVVRGPGGKMIGACQVDGVAKGGMVGFSFPDLLDDVGARLGEFLLDEP